MKIRTRLTLLFTSLVAALLIVFALSVYYDSSMSREEEYFKRLKQQGVTKANLLFDTKVPPEVLQLIYKKAPDSLFQEEVAIYDSNLNLLYRDAVKVEKIKATKGMSDSILSHNEIRFYLGKFQVVGFLYAHNNNRYIITSSAMDGYGLIKQAELRNTLIIAFLGAIILILFVGRFLAMKALEPVSTLVEKVKSITATNLDLRVDEGNRKDEIAALAITFNEMLDRLEKSFEAQKHFVSNISHELRTPLTAMLAEMQLTLHKEREIKAYQETIGRIVSDTRKLIRLSNSLLDLAKANYDQTEIAFKPIRVDEVLLDARNDVLNHNLEFKINIVFEKEIDTDSYISIYGNEYLLKVAFINLMENGCKFSHSKQSTVAISYTEEQVMINFSDNGVGINNKEINHIFTPFYRGSNKKFADGNGIGLFLTQKIIHLHGGSIEVASQEGEGTIFMIQFDHLQEKE